MIIKYTAIILIGILLGIFNYIISIKFKKNEKITADIKISKTTNKKVELFPLLRFLPKKQKAKNNSKEKISKYLLVQSISSIGFFLIFYIYNFKIQTLIGFVLISMLTITSILDLEERTVSNKIYIFFTSVFLAITIYNGQYFNIIVGITCLVFFYIVASTSKKIVGQAILSESDIKMFGAIGLVLGFNKIVLAVFISSILGIIIIRLIRLDKGKYQVFIPLISVGSFFAFILGDRVIDIYIKILYML